MFYTCCPEISFASPWYPHYGRQHLAYCSLLPISSTSAVIPACRLFPEPKACLVAPRGDGSATQSPLLAAYLVPLQWEGQHRVLDMKRQLP